MIPRLEAAYCLDDEIYFSKHVSATFTVDGERIYLVRNYNEYLELKRRHTTTHSIFSIEPCADMYKVTLCGSDGSLPSFNFTAEAMYWAIDAAHEAMQTHQLALVA